MYTGYIEPVEFASLGLLAVAFVSMSSADLEMRKLGYKTLGRFVEALKVIIIFILSSLYMHNLFLTVYCKLVNGNFSYVGL